MFALVLLHLSTISGAGAISCFSCVSPLPKSTPKDAQIALKTVLEISYKLPPVDKYCKESNDVFFRTILKTACNTDDRCVKISATDGG